MLDQRLTPSGCKYLGIRKYDFGGKNAVSSLQNRSLAKTDLVLFCMLSQNVNDN